MFAGLASPAAAAPRVIVIGLDAVSTNILQPFIEQGVTPTLGKLTAEGAHGDLESFWPLRTPQVWTSIATGKVPGQHGIWDNVSNSAYNPPALRTKERRLLTSGEWRSKALWQIVGERGLAALVVGWISSWPAQRLPQVTMAAPAVGQPAKREVSIKGAFWRDATRQVAPEALWGRIRPLVVEPQDLSPEDVAAFADLPPAGSPLYALPLIERYAYALRWSIARSKSVEAITLDLAATVKPDVLLTYFQCSDSLLHRFWIFHEDVGAIRERLDGLQIPSTGAAELRQRFGRVVEACYRDLDARVGRILAAVRGPETLVLVVSDHGFGEAPASHPSRDEPYGGNHRELGIILAAGPGVAPASTLRGASVFDITPSVLYALGLPVGADMRGRVVDGLFAPGELERRPPTSVPSYESTPQTQVTYPGGWPTRKERPVAVDR